MGFIDYHGKREDRYKEVVSYAKIQDMMEKRAEDEKLKRIWISEILENPVYGSLEAGDTIKFVIKKYRDALDSYRKLTMGSSQGVDSGRLWKDLWLYVIGEYLEIAELIGDKREALLQGFYEKVLKIGTSEEVKKHIASYECNRKYARYIRKVFSLKESENTQFWRWLAIQNDTKSNDFERFIDDFSECICLLFYYIYQKSHPEKEAWIYRAERDKRLLDELKMRNKEGKIPLPVYKKMKNLLYQEGEKISAAGIFRYVLLFHKKKRGIDGEEEMIEELYEYLGENTEEYRIESIVPKKIKEDIDRGILPEFKDAVVAGLNADERVHYFEHGIFYLDKEVEEDISFQIYKGNFVITEREIIFRGGASVSILFEEISRVIRYDMKPEIVEICTVQGKSWFFGLPDMGNAYHVLRLIANKKNGKAVEEKTVEFDYETLVEKSDISACIFAFECVENYELPEELKRKIALLLRKMRGLKTAVEDYPERKNEIFRFLNYYIPEAVGIVDSYYRYQQAELQDRALENLYQKLNASIELLDAAVEQKIFSIYRIETMNTTAKADALKQILEQDGYSADKRILKL